MTEKLLDYIDYISRLESRIEILQVELDRLIDYARHSKSRIEILQEHIDHLEKHLRNDPNGFGKALFDTEDKVRKLMEALSRIELYETDFSVGLDENVVRLQTMASDALQEVRMKGKSGE
jgi:predicted  nucleic acid-binding Zn-ribbon protein